MFVIRQKTSWILIRQLSLATFTNHTNTVYSKKRCVSKGGENSLDLRVYLVFDLIFAPKTFGLLPETNSEEAIHKRKGFIFQPSMLSCEGFKEEIHHFFLSLSHLANFVNKIPKSKIASFHAPENRPFVLCPYLLTRSRQAREDPCLWLRTATSFVKPFFAFRLFACRSFACSYSCWSFNQRRNQLMRFFQGEAATWLDNGVNKVTPPPPPLWDCPKKAEAETWLDKGSHGCPRFLMASLLVKGQNNIWPCKKVLPEIRSWVRHLHPRVV